MFPDLQLSQVAAGAAAAGERQSAGPVSHGNGGAETALHAAPACVVLGTRLVPGKRQKGTEQPEKERSARVPQLFEETSYSPQAAAALDPSSASVVQAPALR